MQAVSSTDDAGPTPWTESDTAVREAPSDG